MNRFVLSKSVVLIAAGATALTVTGCATSGGDAHPREFTTGKVNTSVDANAASAVFLRQ